MTMPLGEIESKTDTRAHARAAGLTSVANKPDSQEICFVQGGSYVDFLAKEAPELVSAGNFVDSSGAVRGTHDGSAFYTIGQRKRINVGSATPLYVLQVDAQNNTVVVGTDEELYAPGCTVDDIIWGALAPTPPGEEIPCEVKIRYNMEARPATFTRNADGNAYRELRRTASRRDARPGVRRLRNRRARRHGALRWYDNRKIMNEENDGHDFQALLAGTVIGLAVGGALGLLFAPQGGQRASRRPCATRPRNPSTTCATPRRSSRRR